MDEVKSNSIINKIFIVVVFLVLAFLSFIIVQGFLLPVFLGALIAYTLYPIYASLIKQTKSERESAAIISMGAVIVFCLLLILIVPDLVVEVNDVWRFISYVLPEKIEEVRRCSSEQTDLVCVALSYAFSNINSSELINRSAFSFFRNVLNVMLFITVVLFSAVYFLHNGRRLVEKAIHKMPLKDSNKKKAVARIDEVLKAVIFGNLLTAFVEGVLVTIFFLLLGIRLAFVAGLLVMFFALIPPFGAMLVWGSAVVALILVGEYIKAFILLVLCLATLGYIDNFARPSFIGKKVRLSAFWILLGVFGGLGAFGFAGVIIGPLVLSLFVTSINILLDEIADEGEKPQ